MTIMRHQTALTVGEGDVIEWRHLLLDWMPLAWLLYFLKLLTLTATYVATRSRLERQLAEQPEPIDEQSFRKAAHCRRFSTVPMGDDDENAESATLETVQSGYRTWFFGVFLYALWMLVPIVSQLQLVWLTMERYFGLGWDATAKQFILIYLISHVILFAATQYSGQLKTFFLQPSSLAEATHIAIFPRDKTKGLGRLEVVRVRHLPGSETGSGGSTTVQSRRYYEQTCVRYLWNEEARRFRPTGVKPLSGQEAYKALDGGGLAENFALERLDRQGRNAINVKVLGIFASLLAEYSQPIYIFQMMCIWCYLFFDSWNIALLWVFLVFGSGAWTSLMILRRNQQQIAEMAAAGGHRLEKVLRDGQWKDVPATDLTLGDVVQVKDGVVCADLALVAGSAVVNESMLTGEPMPLQKVSLEQNSEALFDYKTHGKKQGLFAGTEVLQSVADEASNANRGSTLALAVVVAIGARTTKGRLIRMVLYPALVKFKYTEQLPVVYAFMTLWATICFIATMTFQGQGWVNGFFVGISFLTQSMNPMMAVSFTLGQSAAALRLKEKNISCLNIGRIPIAGKISTMVFDKTGTITHGGMDLAGVRPVDEGRFEAEVSAKDLHNLEPKNVFLKALASCHTVSTMRDGSFVGNQVEIVTVMALQWRLSAPGQARVIASPDGQTQLEVLRQLEFDHHRMTSGALVRCKETQRVLAFFKGAYDKISQIADPSSVPADYKDLCESYASQCYYVLAMSWKELQVDDAQLGDITRDSLEQGLKICGLLFFRNEMKADSKEVIKELKEGGVSCVICTGDNTTTGVSIGRQCGIFSDKARVLVGELAEPDTFKPSKLHWRDADDKEAEVPHWQFDNAELALSQSAFRWLVREKPEELSEMLPSIKVFGRMKPDVEIVTVKALQWRLSAPGQARVIASPDGQTQLEVLRQLEFDHHRMTSGALVRCKETQRVLAFFKGAYDKISQIADPSSVPADYKDLCESYASQCYYVLAMSWKELQVDDAQLGDITRDSLEQGLKICGLLFFRNEMKADSREVIKELKEGGVSCVICTGDNTTTGVSIGRQCGIFLDKARVLVGELAEPDTFKPSKLHWRDADDKEAEVPHWQFDNAELALSQSAFRWLVREKPEELSEMLPSIKVFGRMKPDDKIKVINLWQDYGDGVVTGMVGDGGNDCGALRTAHAGLALSEAEASMVSPFSSSKGLSEQGFISLAAVVDLIKEGRCCLATNMATFMYFMIYNLTLTTSKMLAVIWMDSTYAEWQFMLTDVALAMVMVSFMVRCRPIQRLSMTSPSASLFGIGTMVTILSALLIFWLTAGVAVLMLQYGPGRSFYEFSTSILLEIPPQQWTRKADNYLMATLFLVNLTVLLNAGFVLCYGHIHRQMVGKNWRICSFYILGLLFTLALTWSNPSEFSCTFRVNCDSAASQKMSLPLLSKPVAGVIFSRGNLGGCFWGPQMLSCKSQEHRCWVTPPNNANLPPSWAARNSTLRPKAPFDTREEKMKFCKKHPYRADAKDLGNQWCWLPVDDALSRGCGPSPTRDLGPMVEGCHGPNNCYSRNFKFYLTGILIPCSVSLHAMYKLGVLGLE